MKEEKRKHCSIFKDGRKIEGGLVVEERVVRVILKDEDAKILEMEKVMW